ncbi:MAG: hypothetical protein WA070_00270 [Sphingobium sp.]
MVQSLCIVNEQASLAVLMSRALTTKFVATAYKVDRFTNESGN